MGDFFIRIEDLRSLVGTPAWPVIFDVRRRQAFDADDRVLPTARWRDHAAADVWLTDLTADARVLVYCVHGHQVSQSAAAVLRAAGIDAAVLAGGIEAWRAAGGVTILKPEDVPTGEIGRSRWMLRTDAAMDDIACAWVVRRFLDARAEILFVAPDQVTAAAGEVNAETVEPVHVMIDRWGINDPALERVAEIIRASGDRDPVPEAPGFALMAAGLPRQAGLDQERLACGFAMLDALYAGCRAEPEATA